MSTNALKDRVAVITGGGRGIGAACAKLFAEQGAKVAILSRTESELRKTAQEIGNVLPIVTDISQESAVKDAFSQIKRILGPIQILVNNAAIAPTGPFIDFDVKTWDKVMAVNLRGSFLCAREAFVQMKEAGKGGCIVNISSLGGIKGSTKFKGMTAYVVSKSGVVGLTESLAVEGLEYGIRVNCVAPGAVDTEMLKKAAPHLKTKTLPRDIAETILDLCIEKQSTPVTGAIVEIHSNL